MQNFKRKFIRGSNGNVVRLYNGNSIKVLKSLPSSCVHSIVTDPPYGISFMNRHWDYDVPSVELWKECLRVLKPGGHLLSFSGSRTYHRMAVNIEDAGFEIRDQIMWVYGSGFPKSLNIEKALSKGKAVIEKWKGWGTALKPAHEPIIVARKPLIGTVADNVAAHNTGGLNIDGCRIPINPEIAPRLGGKGLWKTNKMAKNVYAGGYRGIDISSSDKGRFPANFIHDGSDEVTSLFPITTSGTGNFKKSSSKDRNGNTGSAYGGTGNASRFFYCAKASKLDREEGLSNKNASKATAVRVNTHPTVKPTELMKYLCRLVTPPNGWVLDPFMGSGSTGKAAVLEGFHFIGIDRELPYCKVALHRIKHALLKAK